MGVQSRRRFLHSSLALASLDLASGCGGVSVPAQQPKVPRIGVLLNKFPAPEAEALQ